MKYIKKYLSCLALLSVLLSCSKSLDYSETTFYNEDAVLSSPNLYKALLTSIYTYLPTDFNGIDGAMRSAASDDAVHVWDLSAIKRFNDGSWSALQPLDDQWGTLYTAIRSANRFLKISAGQTFEDLRYNDGYAEMMLQYNNYPYEARFLRAFFYFELIKRYGDVPLITTPLTVEEANAVKKSTYSQVVDFIVAECDAIIPKLPASYATLPGAETGRATKGAAYALKARTLLYAASPLHNPGNDQAKWIAAATAAKQLMDLQLYSLLRRYREMPNNIGSVELILETRQGFSNTYEAANFPVGYEGGNTGTCPSQNLVDSYEMVANGKGINEPGSGYDPNNPYAGRDQRLGETILADGATWKGSAIQVWDGGRNGKPNERATKTGYYLKKYVIEAVSLSAAAPTTQQHSWMLFRYGEVLLNYAEAMNEVYGPYTTGPGILNMTAYDAVNLVRVRGRMPIFPAGMSQADFKTKLRNERRVELAFEDHRFWDIRRWKIGSSTTDIYGMEVNRSSTGALSYTRKLVETRVWNNKMNLYPIPQNELYINKNLTQNPEW
ncbi:RagB/SusD family nutrient uptake outer membrane protein [Pedobacter sp. MC2016-24]|uniref:RagB/SusD family nutrient uptake outer membrane protein n=1 Tax=Pedobacter sp. MC2016-24 TaxID=2780090 RepID=UPI001880DE45|nr:RagB/SusD family nutrient uptake outer membrane protein [Pedobacter sp. MC2016-24]MBE9600272.1 RagB/SusD family nutrient uptake outer membrane protein [Pedobacter sp. MC2016-24]